MPQEFLSFPPAYTVVGAYRLAHDPNLWQPMWQSVQPSLRKASIAAGIWALATWPFQRLIVETFMKGSAKVSGMRGLYEAFIGLAEEAEDKRNIIPLPSLTTFAAFMFVLGQCQTIIELFLGRKLRKFRAQAYSATVSSRGYSTEWWVPYVEEWQEPPYAEAKQRYGTKPSFSKRLQNKVFQRVLFRFILLPLDFIPFLSLAVLAYLRGSGYAQQLLTPFFAQKRMSTPQVHVFLTERARLLLTYGFACVLLERIPILGIVFSISNRVGAAMLAHDLEKRQHKFISGEIKPLPKDQTEKLTLDSIGSLLRPSSPTHQPSVAGQDTTEFNKPGASLPSEKPEGASGGLASNVPSGLKHRLGGTVPASVPNEPPPAYTEHDISEAIGDES